MKIASSGAITGRLSKDLFKGLFFNIERKSSLRCRLVTRFSAIEEEVSYLPAGISLARHSASAGVINDEKRNADGVFFSSGILF